MRAWRNSNVAVCQSARRRFRYAKAMARRLAEGLAKADAVPGAIPGARTNFGAVVFNSQHSGLLIRTVRVSLDRLGTLSLSKRQLPPAPPIHPRSLRTDVGEVSPTPSDLSRGFIFQSRRARAAKGPACKTGVTAGATPAVVSTLGP